MLKPLAKCRVNSVKTEARAPRGHRRGAGRSPRPGRGPSCGRRARTGNRGGQGASPATSSHSSRRLAIREGAVGITRRKKCPQDDSEGRMEVRETTRTGARYRALALCRARGEATMLPGVIHVHLNYRDSRGNGVMTFEQRIANLKRALEASQK